MINKTYNLCLDIKDTKPLKTYIKFTQGDVNTSILNITICDKKEKADLTNVHNCTITFKRPDDTIVINDIEIIDPENGLLQYTLGTSEISIPGEVISTIQFYGENQERLTSTQFIFTVEQDLYSDEATESSNEFPVLVKLLDIETFENDRQEAELQRIEQENTRKRDEQTRNDNEILRQQAYNLNESRFTAIEGNISDLQSNVSTNTQNITNLQPIVTQNTNDISTLQTDVNTINNITIPNLKHYKWIEQKTVPIGSNTITLTNTYTAGQELLLIDTKYTANWLKEIHWNISGQTITFTEPSFSEELTFIIYNLG